jgi:hypothetical protein
MGKIKNWERHGKDRWYNPTHESNVSIEMSSKNKYYIQANSFGGFFGNPYQKTFDTLAEARKKAIAYMRSHPNG